MSYQHTVNIIRKLLMCSKTSQSNKHEKRGYITKACETPIIPVALPAILNLRDGRIFLISSAVGEKQCCAQYHLKTFQSVWNCCKYCCSLWQTMIDCSLSLCELAVVSYRRFCLCKQLFLPSVVFPFVWRTSDWCFEWTRVLRRRILSQRRRFLWWANCQRLSVWKIHNLNIQIQ